MSDNILRILGVENKEDVITNLLKYAIQSSATFRRRFLEQICDLPDVSLDDDFMIETRISTPCGIPDLVMVRKYLDKAELVILENKLKAEEGFEQTARYEEAACTSALEEHFKDFLTGRQCIDKRFIFLTLFNDQPNEAGKFIHKRYLHILSLLKDFPFNKDSVIDTLLHDLKEILEKFYMSEDVSLSDRILEKFNDDPVLDAPFLYFSNLFMKYSQNLFAGFRPPEGLTHDPPFRSSAKGRRFYGICLYKNNWFEEAMKKPEKGQWSLHPLKNIFIHFEPQFNIVTKSFSVFLHYEIHPYVTENRAKNNIVAVDYQAYLLIRAYFSQALSTAKVPNYSPGGGSNQIGKAVFAIDTRTTVKTFLESLGEFLGEATCKIDKALSCIRTFPFDVRNLVAAIDDVAQRCAERGYDVQGPTAEGDDYGLYLKDQEGRNALWAGIWCSQWYKSQRPLSLAVHEDWSTRSVDLFKATHAASLNTFEGYFVHCVGTDDSCDLTANRLAALIDAHMTALRT